MKKPRRCFSQRTAVLRKSRPAVRLLIAFGCCLALAAGPGARRAGAVDYTITDLGSLGGSRTIVYGMNSLGEVVGSSSTGPDSNAPFHGFLFDSTGIHDLNALLGDAVGKPTGINDAGQIVGGARFGGGPWHPYLYDGSLHELTPPTAWTNSWGLVVNAKGHVAGLFESPSSLWGRLAFFYDGTSAHDLGTPSGHSSRPTGINASDQIVGVLDSDS